MCHGQGCRVLLGMGTHPTFNRNPYNWYIKPYYWVDEFIPYHKEIMGVDRPDGPARFKSSFLARSSSAACRLAAWNVAKPSK